jgi:hypothetical protein
MAKTKGGCTAYAFAQLFNFGEDDIIHFFRREVCVCIYLCVYVYVCMYVFLCMRVNVFLGACILLCVFFLVYLWPFFVCTPVFSGFVFVRVCVYSWLWLFLCTPVCVSVLLFGDGATLSRERCIYAHKCVCVCVYVCIYIDYLFICVNMHAYMHVCLTYMHKCMYANIHTYMYEKTYIRTCM